MTQPQAHFNNEAERSVLAVMLYDEDGSYIDRAVGLGLKRSTFYQQGNGCIFDALVMLRSKQVKPDVVLLCQQLQSSNELETAGGVLEISSLAGMGSPARFESHAELLLCLECQRSASRYLADAGMVLNQSYTDRESLDEAIQPKLAWVQNSITRLEKAETLASLVHQAAADAKACIERAGRVGKQIEWGIPDFDKNFTPIDTFETVTIAARTSIGKSSMARDVTCHNLKRGMKIAYFQLESSNGEFVKAMAAAEARVSPKHLYEELIERQRAYAKALDWIGRLDTLKLYDKDLTLEAIESRCRVLKVAFRPDAVIIDHLHLVGISQGRNENPTNAMERMTKRFIALQKYMGCALIMLAQLNRGNEKDGNRQPRLSDLRGSGSIEQDSHRVVLLHRPTDDLAGQNQIHDMNRAYYDQQAWQAKMRNGPTPLLKCKFATRWASFRVL